MSQPCARCGSAAASPWSPTTANSAGPRSSPTPAERPSRSSTPSTPRTAAAPRSRTQTTSDYSQGDVDAEVTACGAEVLEADAGAGHPRDGALGDHAAVGGRTVDRAAAVTGAGRLLAVHLLAL